MYYFVPESAEGLSQRNEFSILLKSLLIAADKNPIRPAEGKKGGGGSNLLVPVMEKHRVIRLQAWLHPGDHVISNLSGPPNFACFCASIILSQAHSCGERMVAGSSRLT